MAKDMTATLDRVQRQGWEVRKTGGGHLAIEGPEGQLVHTGSTPSDARSVANLEGQLRRAGFRESEDDPGRKERLKRSNTKQSQVLEILQSAPGESFDASRIARQAGLETKQANMALFWLKTHHPEIKQPKRGLYAYVPAAGVPVEQPKESPEPAAGSEPADPTAKTQGVWCSCGKWFRTAGYWRGHRDQVPDPTGHEEMLSTMPETARIFTNGNRLKQAESVLAEAAAVVSQVAVRASDSPIQVVPSALPSTIPSLLEAVSTDSKGNLVLRDENGDHWLAVPMRPVL